MISKSYPYLSIAKKYNIPYEQVLRCADFLTHNVPPGPHGGWLMGLEASKDAVDAMSYYKNIQTGVEPFPTT